MESVGKHKIRALLPEAERLDVHHYGVKILSLLIIEHGGPTSTIWKYSDNWRRKTMILHNLMKWAILSETTWRQHVAWNWSSTVIKTNNDRQIAASQELTDFYQNMDYGIPQLDALTQKQLNCEHIRCRQQEFNPVWFQYQRRYQKEGLNDNLEEMQRGFDLWHHVSLEYWRHVILHKFAVISFPSNENVISFKGFK